MTVWWPEQNVRLLFEGQILVWRITGHAGPIPAPANQSHGQSAEQGNQQWCQQQCEAREHHRSCGGAIWVVHEKAQSRSCGQHTVQRRGTGRQTGRQTVGDRLRLNSKENGRGALSTNAYHRRAASNSTARSRWTTKRTRIPIRTRQSTVPRQPRLSPPCAPTLLHETSLAAHYSYAPAPAQRAAAPARTAPSDADLQFEWDSGWFVLRAVFGERDESSASGAQPCTQLYLRWACFSVLGGSCNTSARTSFR